MPNEGLHTRESWESLGSVLPDIIDAVLTPLAVLTTELRYVAVNGAYCAVVGRTAPEMVGRSIFEVFPESDDGAPGLRESLEFALSSGRAHSMPMLRYDVALADGGPVIERYWHVSSIPVPRPDGTPWLVVVNPEEVTEYIGERLRLEAGGVPDAEVPSSTRLRAVDTAFEAVISRLQNLNDLASALVGATASDAIARALLTDGLAMAGAVGGTFITVDQDRFTITDHEGIDAATTERWTTFMVEPGAEPFSDALVGQTPLFFQTRDALLSAYPALRPEIERTAHQAWAVLPLRVGDQVTGAIGLAYAEQQPFTMALELVLYTLANLATQAAARSRLLEEQSAAMRSVEAAFQPSLDPIPGVEVTECYRPASSSTNAGGDWYDIINVTDRCTLIAVGDVANHGPVAVGEMARTRATVHALALQGLAPDEIATQVDLVLSRVSATFTTSVIAILDTETNILTWTTAGHPHPIIRAADGTARFITPTHGAPLGTGVEDAYESSSMQLVAGDTLVLYTDGLVERADEPIDDGFERLRIAVEELAPAPGMAKAVFDRLIDEHRHADDVAVLTLHLTPA